MGAREEDPNVGTRYSVLSFSLALAAGAHPPLRHELIALESTACPSQPQRRNIEQECCSFFTENIAPTPACPFFHPFGTDRFRLTIQ
jgi:hypothetical protein